MAKMYQRPNPNPSCQKDKKLPLLILKRVSISSAIYGKWTKILNTSLSILSGLLVRIANLEDPDQSASEEAVWSGSALFA